MLNKEQTQKLQNEYVEAKYNELKAKVTKATYTAIFRGEPVVEVRCYEPYVLRRAICKRVIEDLKALGYISAHFGGDRISFALDGANTAQEYEEQDDNNEWNDEDDDEDDEDDEWDDNED